MSFRDFAADELGWKSWKDAHDAVKSQSLTEFG